MKPVLERINLARQQSIVAFHYEAASFETPWHFHPQHELTYIEESVGTKFIGDYVGAYEAGELVLLRSNLPHCWKNQVREKEQAKSIVVQWNKGIFAKVPELHQIFTMLKEASKGIIFEIDTTREFLPLLKQLPTYESAELYIKLLHLLLQLSKCSYKTLSGTSFKDDLPDSYSSRMSMIQDFVATAFPRKIYLKEVAGLVNMTEQSFARFFKKMMGRSFFTFLNEYRINMASRMLLDTDWSVAEISFKCGYESLPFFYKQFQKFQQVSPSKYRKQFI
ncbi:MAG: helix-turn-helix domain-containing protein [Bacteroidota bacterium]